MNRNTPELSKLTAFSLYDSAFDASLDDVSETREYLQDYAWGAWEIAVSDATADAILAARKAWTDCADKNTSTFFHTVESPLGAIFLDECAE